ncbi:archease [Candidatus Falkowbacteria bacterium]|nr:archease [Candidatus Falkowbacteria bacterium]
MKSFQILEHPTDLKIKVRGRTLAELFKNAGLALFRSIDSRELLPKAAGEWREIRVESADQESLLVDWLNELIGIHEVEKENYFNIEILKLTKNSVKTKIRGIASMADRFDVKAATYHDLEIKKNKGGFEAVVLFDI